MDQPNQRDWRDTLTGIVKEAVNPLATAVSEMREDIQDLKLNMMPRADVYDRSIMDEKLGKLLDEIKALKAALDLYRLLGIGVLIVALYSAFVQHVTLH